MPTLIKAQASDVFGGFLCEEMGLGKTVITLGTILSNPAPELAQITAPEGFRASRATLVLCSVSLIGQWVKEMEQKMDTTGLRIYVHHGPRRNKSTAFLAAQDIVVTSYSTLAADSNSMFRGKKKVVSTPPDAAVTAHATAGNLKEAEAAGHTAVEAWDSEAAEHTAAKARDSKTAISDYRQPLQLIYWHRIVLDESHVIRTAATKTTKLVLTLQAKHKWCVTGTPICTNVDDLLTQVRFLGISPLDSPTTWHAEISNFANKKNQVTPLFRYFLNTTMIRHTADQVIEGESIVELPPKEQTVLRVALSPVERAAYNKLLQNARRSFHAVAPNADALRRNTLKVLALLSPLRQVCSGGQLSCMSCMSFFGENATNVSNLPVVERDNCSICLDLIERPMLTPCQHAFCRNCILAVLTNTDDGERGPCPLCRKEVRMNKLQPARFSEEDMPTATDDEIAETFFDTKLKVLLAEIAALRERDPGAKVLVFSQFQTTINWLKTKLKENRFDFRTLEGHMTRPQRTKALDDFQNDPPTTIFLLSVRAGAVGINLTQVSGFVWRKCKKSGSIG